MVPPCPERHLVVLLLLALAPACTGSSSPKVGDDTSGDSGSPDSDSGIDYGSNPLVPEAYQYLWDTDASSCDDGDYAIVYHTFTGAIGAAGKLTGTEAYYWFLKAESWEGDCFDTFDVDLHATDTNWSSDPCEGCDLEFSGTWDLPDANRSCPDYDYESFFANDRVTADTFNVILLLDPLSPAGNPNTSTLVMAAFQDDDDTSSYTFNVDYARGDFVPETEGDYEGPAAITWAPTAGLCVSE